MTTFLGFGVLDVVVEALAGWLVLGPTILFVDDCPKKEQLFFCRFCHI